MKTLELVVAMGLLSMLFGCGHSRDRYHSEAAYKRNVSSQVEMTPQTIEYLRGYGVGPDAELQLEYFFYTDTNAKAAKLAAALQDLGYDASHEEVANGDGTFVVNGWTTKIRMDTPVVVEWTKEMCRLGYSHDGEFDGWGTSPSREGTPQHSPIFSTIR